MTPLQLVGGFFDIFLMGGQPPQAFGANQCEAASFFMFSIFMIPLFVFGLVRSTITEKRIDVILLAAIACYLLLLGWMMIGLPGRIASVLLLQFVPPLRAWLAIGLLNLFLIYYYLSRHEFTITLDFKIFAWVYSATLFLILLYVGHDLQAQDPMFIGSPFEIGAIAGVAALMFVLLLLKRKYEFAALLLLFSLVSSLGVNPLYRGLAPLTNSDFAREIRKIDAQDTRKSTWVIFGVDMGNYLAANGAKVLGGTYAYPNLQFWRQIDVTGRYRRVYNRYSHMLVAAAQPGKDASFKLLVTDTAQLTIDPCDAKLANLNVNYFVFTEPATASCLQQIDRVDYPDFPLYIYRRAQ